MSRTTPGSRRWSLTPRTTPPTATRRRAMKEADVDGIVPKVSVRALCARIVEHAEMYDALYEGRLTVAT